MERMTAICPECGKDTPTPDDGGFCINCGARLMAASGGASGGAAERILAELTALYGGYESYVAEKLNAKSAASRFASIFSGGGPLRDDPGHDEFYKNVSGKVLELSDALGGGEACADIAERAVEFMLIESKGVSSEYVRWMFIACDRLAVPLFPYLGEEGRRRLHEAYRRTLQKGRGLPAQKETLKKLRSCP